MGRGLLERQLSQRPQGRIRLDERRLPPPRAARRRLHQQACRCTLRGAVPLRQRRALLRQRLPNRAGSAVTGVAGMRAILTAVWMCWSAVAALGQSYSASGEVGYLQEWELKASLAKT